MTEAEWLSTANPSQLLKLLSGKGSDRKLRLYAVACGRLATHCTIYEVVESTFAMSESFADQQINEGTLRSGVQLAYDKAEKLEEFRSRFERDAMWAAAYSADPSIEEAVDTTMGFVRAVLSPISDTTLCHHARDIFGNPFRLACVHPAWQTSTVLALAQQMYDSRDFAPMPILADALEDAGCENDDILNHCRSGGPHVRGCWVVDLLLGKE